MVAAYGLSFLCHLSYSSAILISYTKRISHFFTQFHTKERMAVSYQIAGIDWGYSYTKICMDGKTYIFPSVIGLGCEISFHMNRRQAIDNISVITDQYYFIEYLLN